MVTCTTSALGHCKTFQEGIAGVMHGKRCMRCTFAKGAFQEVHEIDLPKGLQVLIGAPSLLLTCKAIPLVFCSICCLQQQQIRQKCLTVACCCRLLPCPMQSGSRYCRQQQAAGKGIRVQRAARAQGWQLRYCYSLLLAHYHRC